jgi:hypothetical protein
VSRRIVFVVAVLGFAAQAAPAQAITQQPVQTTLRSPHLSSSCESGFSYGEVLLGVWRVEGCNKVMDPQDGEVSRRAFKGKVELNGMIVEGGQNLVLTRRKITNSLGQDIYKNEVLRDSATLVLDPKIGGTRRRFAIYTGDVHFVTTSAPDKPLNSPAGVNPPPPPETDNTIDIPVGSDAKILGMRLGGTIQDAVVFTDVNGGSIKMKPRMRMGETASALLRDVETNVNIEAVDGTGLKVTKIDFSIPRIEVPGTGGFKDLHVTYSDAKDEWSGSVTIDLGEVFPDLFFDMDIDATSGAPTRIQLVVSPINVMLGSTGIYLQRLSGGFNTNPLTLNAGIGLSAGPEYNGVGLAELDADLAITLEPYFRFDAEGAARFFVVGDSQIAKGNAHVIIDSRGYISIGGSAGYVVAVLGVGASAEISGSGAYSTTTDHYNVQAEATGTLLLGDLGSVDIIKFGAVTSSTGWGTCGNVFFFVKAGVGQQWDHNPKLILNCDLSQFSANVPDPGGSASKANVTATAGARARTFRVARGTKKLAIEIQGAGPEPHVALLGPGGAALAATVPTAKFRLAGPDTVVSAPAGSATQHIFLRNPRAGVYTLRWDAQGGQVTGLRFARDVVPLSGKVSVARDRSKAGRRKLLVSAVKGLSPGDRLAVGVRTPVGIVPIGELARGGKLSARFDEHAAGTHQIVGTIIRDGIPIPGRTGVLGTYRASMPLVPRSLVARRVGSRVAVLAKTRRGAEAPELWQFVARTRKRPFAVARARPGKRALITIPTDYPNITITARPVVGGRVLTGKPLVITFAESHSD